MCSVNPPDVSKLTLTEEEISADLVASSIGLQTPQQTLKSSRLPPPSTKKVGFLKRMKTDMNFFNRISAPAIAEQSATARANANANFTISSDSAETDSATDLRKESSSSAAPSVGQPTSAAPAQPPPPTPSKGGAERTKHKSTSASVVSNWQKLAHSASRAANRLSVPVGPRIFLSPPTASQLTTKAGSTSPSPFHTPVHVVHSEGARLLLEQQQVLGGSSISIHSGRCDGFSDDGSTRTSPALSGGGSCSRFGSSQAPDWLDDVRAVLERHRPSKERVRGWSANFSALLADQCAFPFLLICLLASKDPTVKGPTN